MVQEDVPVREQRNINKSADTVRLETKIKRGTGTRDQDEIKVKVRGDDPEKAAEKLHETVIAVRENGTVDAVRDTQAVGVDDD